MAKCSRLQIDRKKICAGDLRFVIQIIDRAIGPDAYGYKIDLTNAVSTRAAIQTKTQILNFDGTNTGTQITHEFYVRPHVSVQTGFTILFNGKYYSVIGTTNLNEFGNILKITTVEAGTTDNLVNY